MEALISVSETIRSDLDCAVGLFKYQDCVLGEESGCFGGEMGVVLTQCAF